MDGSMKKTKTYVEPLEYPERDERQLLLSGITRDVLIKVFGEPSISFRFQEKELFHYGQPDLSFVELDNGVVTKCHSLPEHRAAFRVQPASPTKVRIVSRLGQSNGVTIDMSVSGMAISFSKDPGFADLEEVYVHFSLPLRGKRASLSIPAVFYRMTKEGDAYKAVFLLSTVRGTAVYVQLARYVLQRQTELLADYREELMLGN